MVRGVEYGWVRGPGGPKSQEADMPRPIHFDLGAIDPARAIAFYKAAFGWTVEKWNGPTGTSNSASCQASRELRSGSA